MRFMILWAIQSPAVSMTHAWDLKINLKNVKHVNNVSQRVQVILVIFNYVHQYTIHYYSNNLCGCFHVVVQDAVVLDLLREHVQHLPSVSAKHVPPKRTNVHLRERLSR